MTTRTRLVLALLGPLALLAAACSGGGEAADDDAEDRFGGDTAAEATESPTSEATEQAEEEQSDGASTGDAEETFGGDEPGDAEESFGDDGSAGSDDTSASGGDRDEEATESATEEATESATEEATEEEPAEESDGSGGFASSTPAPADPPEDPVQTQDYGIRDFIDPADDPLSTFALDVDTGSYSVVRNLVANGQLPSPDAVRVEEFVNAFDYDYPAPESGLAISVDGGPSPFDDDNILVRIGVATPEVDEDDRRPAALTFVIDSSGSMGDEGRLELVKAALEELVDELDEDDSVAIVTFSTVPRIVLEPVSAGDEQRLRDAIRSLAPEGNTNLQGGLELGYQLAEDAFDDDQINRVILLSDGIANVGLQDPDSLAELIRADADAGIDLVTIGVGLDGYNDVLMEQLADQGNGFYAYIDTEDQAEALFEERLTATLQTAARDAKIQVRFDSSIVDEYRLIGFENRGVHDDDFTDDDVDAGELGAGHQVTAIYELELEDDLEGFEGNTDLGEVSLRWADPDSGEVTEIDVDIEADDVETSWGATSPSLRLAVVVAAFAEVLRDSPHRGLVDLGDVSAEAHDLANATEQAAVVELADLVDRANDLARRGG